MRLTLAISKRFLSSVCSTGDVRLRGGSNHLEGRVEYCVRHLWGTVCSEGWGEEDTAVVCTELGFTQQGVFLCGELCAVRVG